MQFLEVDDLVSALSFVESAVVNEPDNIIASYLLVKINLELGEINEARVAVNKALAINKTKSLGQYEHRLLFFKGNILAASGEIVNAQKTLLNAEKLAKENKDWLYYAYNQTMLAKIKVAQRKYDDAYQLLHSALEYQELLNCPMGIAQGHLDFADFYLQKGDTPSAQRSFKQAQTIVQQKNLQQVFTLLSEMKQRLVSVN